MIEKLGIGIDITYISDFEKISYEKNPGFYQKIFQPSEINYCLTKANPYMHFTARFCAKEAAIKALKNNKIDPKKIEIIMNGNIPSLRLPENRTNHLSISHTKKYAVATVLIL